MDIASNMSFFWLRPWLKNKLFRERKGDCGPLLNAGGWKELKKNDMKSVTKSYTLSILFDESKSFRAENKTVYYRTTIQTAALNVR